MNDFLLNLLIQRIKKTGPITVAEFMAEALHHKNIGYYTNKDPLGIKGDFTTAPEISQIFGELIGLWVINILSNTKIKKPICLVELGPGRGTLMSDMLRAMSKFLDLDTFIEVHLVETNVDLRRIQSRQLGEINPKWHDDLSTLPNTPWFLVANEFLDTLPIRQIVRSGGKWMERFISYDRQTNRLAWTLKGSASNLGFLVSQEVEKGVNENAIIEVSPALIGIFKTVADNIAKNGGAALIIDYGYLNPIFKSSLQAIKNHQFIDPLSQPGNADISSHVDFALLKREAKFFDINFHGPISQGMFLKEMGINERAKALEQDATSEQSRNIQGAVDRLINKDAMGELFKVIALTPQQIKQAPGFAN